MASLAGRQKEDNPKANHAAVEMLLQSLQTLKRLRLGFENALGKSYAHSWNTGDGFMGPYFGERTADYLSLIKDRINSTGLLPKATRLEELSLCGMDLNRLAPEVCPVDLNLGGLTSLRLESCLNLPQALPMLVSQTEKLNTNVGGLSNLRSFSVRVEKGDDKDTMRAIKDLLMITKPLKTLHFLCEGTHLESITQDVLERHGPSLDTLVWDTRPGPRSQIEFYGETEQWSIDCSTIKRYCVNLKALGLSLAWENAPLHNGRPTIGPLMQLLSHVNKLEVLNLRHMPSSFDNKFCLTCDFQFLGLAQQIVHHQQETRGEEDGCRLKLLAFGALTYGSLRMGGHFDDNYDRVSDYLKLRIYHVRRTFSQCRQPPFVELVSAGVADGAVGYSQYVDIFEPYWLDGIPFDADA